MLNAVYSAIALFFWLIFIISFTMDRSRYRNCYFLFAAILTSIPALTFIAGEHQAKVIVVLFNIILIGLLIVPIFLICNGIIMFRREGHSLSNLLSLFLGIGVGFGELATFSGIILPAFAGTHWIADNILYDASMIGIFIGASVFYFSSSFVVFMLYCIFLQVIPKNRNFDYIIIHGAGLLKGDRISKLLSDRLDKAIEIYHKAPTPPVLIPSGGKGPDENLSEAEAMELYLLGKGIPADKILREDKSATTYENLRNSKAIIDSRTGSKYTALVTSNYHVYRALRYCRKMGLECTGIGSHVAFYYWPSALIREFIAVHAEKKHLIYLIAGWILFLLPLFLIYFAR